MALYNGIAEVVREGKSVVAGEMALDGSNPTPLVTPFRVVKAVYAMIKANATPGDVVSILTYDVSGNTVNFYAWVHGATDPTLVASTATHTISYIVVGVL